MLFWESNIFWGIAGIVGGFIVAAFFFYIGKVKKSLLYQISTSALITDEINRTPGLRISVGDEPAVDVISTTITFINGGNQTITSSDFASLSPLQIITSGHFFNAENIDVDYIKALNNALNPRIHIVDKKRIEIEFEYLKPKQEFEITLLHDGKLSVSGDLKTGTLQSYNSALKASKYKSVLKEYAPLFIMMAFALLSIISSIQTTHSKQVNVLEDNVHEMYERIEKLEIENQQLRDMIYSLLTDETVSGDISEPK